MTSRHHREATAEATRLGFEWDRCNGKGHDVYTGHGIEVVLSPGIHEAQARDAVRRMRKAAGESDQSPHRNPAAVKERQRRERERIAAEQAKHAARLDAIRRVNAGRHLADATRAEVNRIVRRMSELDRLDRQMRDVPVGAAPYQPTTQGSTA